MKHMVISVISFATLLLLALILSAPLLAVARADSGDVIGSPVNIAIGRISSDVSSQNVSSGGVSMQDYANVTLGASDVYPQISSYYFSVNLTVESKSEVYFFANFTFSAVGTYTVQNILSLTNPSDRWRNWVSGAALNASTAYLNVSATQASWYPYAVLVDRGQTLTDVYQINVTVQVTSAPVTNVLFGLLSHSVITDVNGDGVVNMKDISAVAKYVTTVYTDGSLTTYDMNMDGIVDLVDVQLVAIDFGFTVPSK